jgi:hypothetical protein
MPYEYKKYQIGLQERIKMLTKHTLWYKNILKIKT